jgi:hypothetical protein
MIEHLFIFKDIPMTPIAIRMIKKTEAEII